MSLHGGDVLVEMLLQHRASVVFGVPGGQTLPLYDAIDSRTPEIRHILMRDEVNAAYAADGYARISRRVGVCDATVGPGSVKLTSGLAEAYNSSIPMIAIISEQTSDWLAVKYRGCGNQQVEQRDVLLPLCKWSSRLPSTRKIPEQVQRAFQMATTGRPGPVVIELPEDLFKANFDGEIPTVDSRFGSVPCHRPAPEPETLRKVIDLLASAKRPVMLVGGGAWLSGASEQVTLVAEQFCMPVATSLSGKGIISEKHPLSIGVVGSLGGNPVSQQIVADADMILAVGFKFGIATTNRWKVPSSKQRIIHLDIDPAEMGKIYPTEIQMVCDARSGLEAILSTNARKSSERELITKITKIKDLKSNWLARVASETANANPIKPQQVVSLLNELAGPDVILVSDASFSSGWAGTYFDVTDNRRAIFPRGTSVLGWALPAAIGAKIARPGVKVIVLAGDCGFNYSLTELATLRQEGLNITSVVLNNRAMAWINWDTALDWEGKFLHQHTLTPINYALVAEGFGCTGLNVANPEDLRPSLITALTSDIPTVVDVCSSAIETPVSKFLDSESARMHIQSNNQI